MNDGTITRQTGGLARSLPLVTVILVAISGPFLLGDRLSFDALADHRERLIDFRDAHYWATVTGFIAAYVVIVLFSLPGATVATLTGGFLFATFPGVFYNIAAATIGATGLFLAARWGLGNWLAARMDAATRARFAAVLDVCPSKPDDG